MRPGRNMPGHDEVGASLDLIDRLVMKQRKSVGVPAPVQRLAIAARTLAHEVKTPLNALAIHLEVLRNKVAAGGRRRSAIGALDCGARFEHSPGRSAGARLHRLLGAGDHGTKTDRCRRSVEHEFGSRRFDLRGEKD